MGRRLELDTSVLNENTETHASLTDINNLYLFTDDFNRIIDQKKIHDHDIEKSYKDMFFIEESTNDSDDEIINNLFQTSTFLNVQEITQDVDYGNYYILLGSMLLGILICCIVFGITGGRNKS